MTGSFSQNVIPIDPAPPIHLASDISISPYKVTVQTQQGQFRMEQGQFKKKFMGPSFCVYVGLEFEPGGVTTFLSLVPYLSSHDIHDLYDLYTAMTLCDDSVGNPLRSSLVVSYHSYMRC